jgi:hypothetical protein
MAICFVVLTETGLADVRVGYDGNVVLCTRTDPESKTLVLNGMSWKVEDAPPFEHNESVLVTDHGKIIDGTPPEHGPIYHYTSLNSATLILESQLLRMALFARANDDRERQQWFFDVACKDDSAPPLTPMIVSAEMSRALKDAWSFISFSHDRISWPNVVEDKTRENDGWKQPSMWAHYARRHQTVDGVVGTGAVLVFDRKVILSDLANKYDSPIIMGNIIYYDEGDGQNIRDGFVVDYEQYNALGIGQYVGAHLIHHWKSLFLTKYTGWSYEAETRLMINTPYGEERTAPIERSLREVMVGEGATKEEIARIKEAVSRFPDSDRIMITAVRWRNGLPIRVPIAT